MVDFLEDRRKKLAEKASEKEIHMIKTLKFKQALPEQVS